MEEMLEDDVIGFDQDMFDLALADYGTLYESEGFFYVTPYILLL